MMCLRKAAAAKSTSAPGYWLAMVMAVCMIAMALTCRSQTCEGSLGDPVVNITFGNGISLGNPLPFTSYDFENDDCPDDGEYTIISRSTACYGATWHAFDDHTPADQNGYMMLINAGFQPGDFYKQTVQVCPNTTYEFGAWLVNVLTPSACPQEENGNGIDPQLTFTIETRDGTPLQQFTTGSLPETLSPQWKRFAFLFATPEGVSDIVLRITNNARGGCGNDLALDDITFRACGPVLDVNNTASAPPLCEGENGAANLTASVSSGFANPVYQWQVLDDTETWVDIPGANAETLTFPVNTARPEGYTFRFAAAEGTNISSPSCRVYSEAFKADVLPKPEANAGPDLVTAEGQPVRLKAVSSGEGLIYRWSPVTGLSNPDILNPTAAPGDDITYTLSVTSTNGCTFTVTDQVFIKVLKKLVIPNTFTPNGDGFNDSWTILALDTYSSADVSVFNRYGQKVFHSTGYSEPWDGLSDGRNMPVGTYYYLIDLKNGNELYRGTVTVLR